MRLGRHESVFRDSWRCWWFRVFVRPSFPNVSALSFIHSFRFLFFRFIIITPHSLTRFQLITKVRQLKASIHSFLINSHILLDLFCTHIIASLLVNSIYYTPLVASSIFSSFQSHLNSMSNIQRLLINYDLSRIRDCHTRYAT